MKKSLVALAALAVAGVASAQSSVTLFGTVDAAVAGYSNRYEYVPTLSTVTGAPVLLFVNPGSVRVNTTALINSGYNSSRIGFRGTEDLGGGLAASFWLEAGVNNDDGTGQNQGTSTGGGLNFNRRSTVSLSGGFGEIRLGRDYTPTFWNDTVFDPFGTNGVGTNLISIANGFASGNATASGFTINNQYVRASNSVGYFLPANLGGFYGQAMYSFNEKPKYDGAGIPFTTLNYDSRSGTYAGGRFGYANGPLDIAASYGESTVASNYLAGTTGKLDTANIGSSYDFGVVKLFGEYSQAKLKVDNTGFTPIGAFNADPRVKGALLGLTVPIGAGQILASYSLVKYDLNRPAFTVATQGAFAGNARADKIAIGYVYNLSKRTALYTAYGYIKDKNGADLTNGGNSLAAGQAALVSGATLQLKNSQAYEFGIRHAF
jgi:predicted porin